MAINKQLAQSYVQDTLKKMEQSPGGLDSQERRLCRKYQKYNGMAAQLQQDVQTLRNQIQQAEANIRSKELQVADAAGKAGMAIEMLVSLKFEDENEADAEFQKAMKQAEAEKRSAPPQNPGTAGGDGNRKQRRATKTRSKKVKKTAQAKGAQA